MKYYAYSCFNYLASMSSKTVYKKNLHLKEYQYKLTYFAVLEKHKLVKLSVCMAI